MPQKVTLEYEGDEYTIVVATVDMHEKDSGTSYMLRGTDPYCYPQALQDPDIIPFFSGSMAAGPDGVDAGQWPAAHVGPTSPVSVVRINKTDEDVPTPASSSF